MQPFAMMYADGRVKAASLSQGGCLAQRPRVAKAAICGQGNWPARLPGVVPGDLLSGQSVQLPQLEFKKSDQMFIFLITR